jgi:hypothetical protein
MMSSRVRIAFAALGDDMDLWKQAYQNQFGSDPDDDMGEHADEVEAWRTSWQGGYDTGEEWAMSLLEDDLSDGAERDA